MSKRFLSLSVLWKSVFITLLAMSLSPSFLLALPIGFGFNQDEADYNEIESENFYIYHDSRVPHEGAMTSNALEAVKPTLDQWFGLKRSRKLPVILSALSSHASFANFITDAIELQTLGEGDRDLFWHEYVHTMTYEHFHNFFGPAGSILHLPWVPAWFLEGMAEALSVSVGSDVQASVERYQALTNQWPSFDRMHSLYGNSSFFLQGYSTAGAYVAWLLRLGIKKNSDLKKFMNQFYQYTTPLFYLWSVNPFSDFMPVDEVLRDYMGHNAKKLFERYKKEALDHWSKHKKGPFLVQFPGERLLISHLAPVIGEHGEFYMVFNDDGRRRKMKIRFEPKSGWMNQTEDTLAVLPTHPGSIHHISRPGLNIGVVSKMESTTGLEQMRIVLYDIKGKSGRTKILKTIAYADREIYAMVESPEKIIWMEKDFEKTRLCFIPKSRIRDKQLPVGRDQVECPVSTILPKTLKFLGVRKKKFPAIGIFPPSKIDRDLATEVWLGVEEQTLAGNRSKILVWDTAENTTQYLRYNGGGTPLQLASTQQQDWLLVAERNRRSLRKIDSFGRCQGVIHFEDYVTQVSGDDSRRLALGVYHGNQYGVLALDPNKLELKSCEPGSLKSSPLIWAMQQNRPVGAPEALVKGSPWKIAASKAEMSQEENSLVIASGLDEAKNKSGQGVTPADSKPASWRPRPVLAFPWIGADDALGTQMGLVSVPLMDHMQNETVRMTLLYGLNSRYPNTEITLNSTRFWPTIDFSVYRRQLWNGACQNSNGDLFTSYMDEKGVHAKSSFPWFYWNGGLSLTIGLRAGHLRKYLGPCAAAEGRLNEPYVEIGSRQRVGDASIALTAKLKVAPEQINTTLDYNVLSSGLSLSMPAPLRSRFSMGIEGSRTRGKKRMVLKEIYQPLKTFVPGSGGGYNKNSFPVTGGGSLFTVRYGDTQARFKSSLTVPLVSSLDKQIWLFYFQSLNFSAFYNYGGAWNHGTDDYRDHLVGAHGYNMDLLFENKGVGFNVSLGSGQVVGDVFQVYLTFGFDAFF